MTLDTSGRDGFMALHVSTFGRYAEYVRGIPFDGDIATTFTAPALLAAFHPLKLPFQSTIARFWVSNAATANGTMDLGLYSYDFNLLHSTTNTARSGASQVQYVGVTDKIIPPGRYWIAGVFSSGSIVGLTPTTFGALFGAGVVHQQLASATLPSLASPHPITNINGIYHIGYTQSDTL